METIAQRKHGQSGCEKIAMNMFLGAELEAGKRETRKKKVDGEKETIVLVEKVRRSEDKTNEDKGSGQVGSGQVGS